MTSESQFRVRIKDWLFEILDNETICDLESQLEEMDMPSSAYDVAMGLLSGWIIIGRN